MDYVFALNDGVNSAPDGAMVTTRRGDVWTADDPFVAQRPDCFSADPPVVHNTTGATQLEARPLSERKPAKKAAAKK